jgi:Curlin associated repeat
MFAIATKIAASALIALSVSAIALAPTTAAHAGGSIGIKINPKGKDAQKLKAGLQILSALQGLKGKNRAGVKQNGKNNCAGVGQKGSNNDALILQEGSGHCATATQNGNNNGLGIIQLGKNTNADVSQNGDETGLLILGGW